VSLSDSMADSTPCNSASRPAATVLSSAHLVLQVLDLPPLGQHAGAPCFDGAACYGAPGSTISPASVYRYGLMDAVLVPEGEGRVHGVPRPPRRPEGTRPRAVMIVIAHDRQGRTDDSGVPVLDKGFGLDFTGRFGHQRCCVRRPFVLR